MGFMKSPKTTIGGVLSLLACVGHLFFVVQKSGLAALANETETIAIMVTAIAVIFARDNKTSDQQAGVRPEPEVRRAEPVNKGIHGGRPNS